MWWLCALFPSVTTCGYAIADTYTDRVERSVWAKERSTWLLQQQELLQEERNKNIVSSVINLGIVVVIGYVILQK